MQHETESEHKTLEHKHKTRSLFTILGYVPSKLPIRKSSCSPVYITVDEKVCPSPNFHSTDENKKSSEGKEVTRSVTKPRGLVKLFRPRGQRRSLRIISFDGVRRLVEGGSASITSSCPRLEEMEGARTKKNVNAQATRHEHNFRRGQGRHIVSVNTAPAQRGSTLRRARDRMKHAPHREEGISCLLHPPSAPPTLL